MRHLLIESDIQKERIPNVENSLRNIVRELGSNTMYFASYRSPGESGKLIHFMSYEDEIANELRQNNVSLEKILEALKSAGGVGRTKLMELNRLIQSYNKNFRF